MIKKLEIIFVVLFLHGVLLRFISLEWSNELLIVSALMLFVIYVFFGFSIFTNVSPKSIFSGGFKGVPGWQIGVSIWSGIVMCAAVAGLLFRMLLLTGADEMLILAVIGVSATTILVSAVMLLKKQYLDPFYARFFKRMIPALVLTLIFVGISSSDLYKIYTKDNPEEAERIRQKWKEEKPK
ncbi:hypothetical protein LVD15_20020 [Fulvivirga maritima]|uniref:hypothetical protein n=1 Tax=Fulvivirga maritima TaxID=2904247 RepID=UPI001F42819D|nr:hypothetical protein [Fulvivirga maritima]UII25572.1 hypothetical protein LVD15_20020 [Fulvivirga maritima]